MNAVSEDIKDKLVSLGIGVFGGKIETNWNIFINNEPANPTQTITVYDTPVGRFSKAYNRDNHGRFSTFQLRVRAQTSTDAHDKAESIIPLLDRIGKFRVGDISYDNVILDSEPTYLKKDEHNRHTWIMNGTAVRQPIA